MNYLSTATKHRRLLATAFRTTSKLANLLACGAIALLSTIGAAAAPGDLDPAFGSNGVVKVAELGDGGYYTTSRIYSQSDGKLVTFETGGLSSDCWTRRFNSNGTPDLTFGDNGLATCRMIGQQPDGRYLAFEGSSVYRYDPNMSPESGTLFIGGHQLWYVTGLLQPDGKVVLIGSPDDVSPYVFKRYLPNGLIDTSFGNNGTSTPDYSVFSVIGSQPDGSLIVRTVDSSIVRVKPDGSQDDTFGTNGRIAFPSVYDDDVNIVVQSDGKIALGYAVYVADFSERWFVRRFNSNGTRDTTFGVNGEAAVYDTDFNKFHPTRNLLAQKNGRLVVAGRRNGNPILLRLNSDGQRDLSFGVGGVATPPLYYGFTALAEDSRNRIVGAGVASDQCLCYELARFDGAARTSMFDFDGDARSDISVFRPSDQTWYILASFNGWTQARFGLATDDIAPADFDGDGKTDIAIFRDGVWWRIDSSTNSMQTVAFGQSGDVPAPSDFTGDGRAEIAVYRGGSWWSLDLSNGQTLHLAFGLAGDHPIAADFDGDGRSDQAVYRGGVWHINRSTQGYAVIQFGLASDVPTPGDYDGDGLTDPAVYRGGTWYVLGSSRGFTAFQFGLATDIAVPADYDGDGRTDAAVYRDGEWWIWQSSSGLSRRRFGLGTDLAVPAAFSMR
jgi:uncharacterized delta-60 repeat protein